MALHPDFHGADYEGQDLKKCDGKLPGARREFHRIQRMSMSKDTTNPATRIALFQRKEVRRVIHNNEWWFVIADVVAVLTDSVNPSDYLKKIRQRDPSLSEAFKGGGQFVSPLGLQFDSAGGRQVFQCWNTEGIFRLIQSIPSAKAEPFKRWLAKVGYERIQEIEDPELGTKRTRALYKAKGYPDDWIEKRMRSIAIREELTGEWKNRGVGEDPRIRHPHRRDIKSRLWRHAV
ncbi:MAG TPA: Bro-N domain-containing protein [Blastocatellia bacterium]|nr:Bro-N domain-containing protein [Blastocatellia bacterium]